MGTSPLLQDQYVSATRLVEIVKATKALHVSLMSLMSELAALRRTTLDDSDLRRQYRDNLDDAVRTARPLVAEAAESYDQFISALEDSVALRH